MYKVEVINGEVVVPEAVQKEIIKLQEFQITKQEMENEEKLIKEALYKAMEEAGIKTFEISGVAKCTIVPPTSSKRLDKKLIVAAGLDPNDYMTVSPKDGYLRVTYAD